MIYPTLDTTRGKKKEIWGSEEQEPDTISFNFK